MKRLCDVALLIAVTCCFSGCAFTLKDKKTQNDGAVVFNEIKDEIPLPEGLTEVVIKASIKTHEEGFFWFEPKKSLHGKSGYPFIITIDRQKTEWIVKGSREDIPTYDEQGNINFEAGVGIRYSLEKKIRLAAGPHTLMLTLPAEKLSTQMEVVLRAESSHVLEFKPFYRHHDRHTSTFLCTIEGYTVLLDGKPLVVWNRKS